MKPSDEVISVAGPLELLQHVRLLTGFELVRSLVCIAFRDDRSVGAFRLTTPPRRDERAFSASIVGLAARFASDTEFVLILYDEQPCPRIELVETVSNAIEAAGFAMRDVLWVARQQWGSYGDGRREMFPYAEEVRRSPNQLGAAVNESARFQVSARVVTTKMRKSETPQADERLLEAVERVCTDRATTDDIVAMIQALAHPQLRDLVLLQFGFGQGHARRHIESLQAKAPQSELDVLAGRGLRAPDFARVIAARTACYQLRSLKIESVHPALWTIEGWLSWAVGDSTLARQCFEYALALDPHYTLAALLEALVSSGHVPDWAFAHAA